MMKISALRSGAVALWVFFGACQSKAPPAAMQKAQEGEAEVVRQSLDVGPMTEVAFVPADAEVLVRVDLAALAALAPQSAQMLDFLLRAQQPRAWKLLGDAGLRAGKELAAVYLVVGPRAKDGAATLLAGVGRIDAARTLAVLRAAGGTVEPAAAGASMLVWPSQPARQLAVGSTVTDSDVHLDAAAVGVADGLLVIGPPELVRRVLAVRAGEGKDVRRGPLAASLAALEPGAAVWGVAREGERGIVAEVAPGLRLGRFHARLAGFGRGELIVRAEFAGAGHAKWFAETLTTLAKSAALLAKSSPVGALLERVAATPVHIDGNVVRLDASL
jgi:hypothetical protein